MDEAHKSEKILSQQEDEKYQIALVPTPRVTPFQKAWGWYSDRPALAPLTAAIIAGVLSKTSGRSENTAVIGGALTFVGYSLGGIFGIMAIRAIIEMQAKEIKKEYTEKAAQTFKGLDRFINQASSDIAVNYQRDRKIAPDSAASYLNYIDSLKASLASATLNPDPISKYSYLSWLPKKYQEKKVRQLIYDTHNQTVIVLEAIKYEIIKKTLHKMGYLTDNFYNPETMEAVQDLCSNAMKKIGYEDGPVIVRNLSD